MLPPAGLWSPAPLTKIWCHDQSKKCMSSLPGYQCCFGREGSRGCQWKTLTRSFKSLKFRYTVADHFCVSTAGKNLRGNRQCSEIEEIGWRVACENCSVSLSVSDVMCVSARDIKRWSDYCGTANAHAHICSFLLWLWMMLIYPQICPHGGKR